MRGNKPAAFNYTHALREVAEDLIQELPEHLGHIDLSRVVFCFGAARRSGADGKYAACMGMRLPGGAREMEERGSRWRIQTLEIDGVEMLYLIQVMLPRFHEEQEYRDKIATVIHELYHISPRFNGDIRRFPGKNYAHGRSREHYHAAMIRLADRYLATAPRAHSWEFLRLSFSELHTRHGGIVGTRVSVPKIIRVN